MIDAEDLKVIAKDRLDDAFRLLSADKFISAIYLSGYALELALKHKICQTLNWQGFPSTNAEFENYRSFKTHNLNVLLSLSGLENVIRSTHRKQWATLDKWNPEIRYSIGTGLNRETAETFLINISVLMTLL